MIYEDVLRAEKCHDLLLAILKRRMAESSAMLDRSKPTASHLDRLELEPGISSSVLSL